MRGRPAPAGCGTRIASNSGASWGLSPHCPGVTRTELGARNAVTRAAERGVTLEEMRAAQEAEIPIRRANTPEDIAAMAVFLASPGARNITGQSYNVDGGLVPS